MADFDVVVIGAGPGGYVAAIRAAQLGFKTACVEKRATLGGTCLNVGCMPSKALLQSSHLYHQATHSLADHGILSTSVKLDLKKMMARKTKVVDDLTKGIEFLFRKNKVEWIKGTASIAAAGVVDVATGGKKKTITADRILIATGSDVATLSGIKIDEKQIVSSTGALELSAVPKKMIVIGAGVIGLEMGSVWSRLGSTVDVVEYLDRITPGMDLDTAQQFQKILAKQGLTFHLGMKVLGAKKDKRGVTLTMEPAAGGSKAVTMTADVVLMAVGRTAYTDSLNLAKIGVAMDARGRILVNDHFETSVAGVYAIGDVIAGPMLAHKAEEEGIVCVEMMAGQHGHINYDLVPSIIYTHPEVATIGKTEEQLKEAGVDYRVGKFPFMANSRARANSDSDGVVKILADAVTDRVLGAHIIGPEAGILIHEIAAVMEFGGSAEDIYRTCHGHPTLSEAVKEAALAVAGRPIHI